MSGVWVELARETGHGHEMRMEHVQDEPWLKRGVTLSLAGDERAWTVFSVCRCADRADGTRDHTKCFEEAKVT